MVIALVAGYAIGGGHVLHVVCDLTIAADNAIFGQTGPKVGSFDGGLGSSYLARIVGQKKAREIWYLCRQYNAEEALDMGLVNKVVPVDQLEAEGLQWASEVMEKSPLAIRCLKSAFNAELDGQSGIQELAGNATLLYYLSEEGSEGKKAFGKERNLLFFLSPVGRGFVIDYCHSGIGFFSPSFQIIRKLANLFRHLEQGQCHYEHLEFIFSSRKLQSV